MGFYYSSEKNVYILKIGGKETPLTEIQAKELSEKINSELEKTPTLNFK